MAKIKVSPKTAIFDGVMVTFKAPCDCTEIDGLVAGGKIFTFRDTHNRDLAGLGNLFLAGACVSVVLDTVNGYAYIQNADTNRYIESRIDGKQNQLGWLTEADIDAMFAGTYEGYEDEAPVDSPLPIEVETEAEMTAILENDETEIGSVYKYAGTTNTYENGGLYIVSEQ